MIFVSRFSYLNSNIEKLKGKKYDFRLYDEYGKRKSKDFDIRLYVEYQKKKVKIKRKNGISHNDYDDYLKMKVKKFLTFDYMLTIKNLSQKHFLTFAIMMNM